MNETKSTNSRNGTMEQMDEAKEPTTTNNEKRDDPFAGVAHLWQDEGGEG